MTYKDDWFNRLSIPLRQWPDELVSGDRDAHEVRIYIINNKLVLHTKSNHVLRHHQLGNPADVRKSEIYIRRVARLGASIRGDVDGVAAADALVRF